MTLSFREESPADEKAIFSVNEAAFERSDEANLVDAVRESRHAALSLVAVLNKQVVGHVLYSPVTVEHNPRAHTVWALGPVAVLPEHQGKGVGASLITASLEICQARDVGAVVLLGHTSYYPRFGFEPASRYDLRFEGEDVGDAFMVLELTKGVLASLSGAVRYVSAFD